MCRKKFLLTVILIPILVGCSIFSSSQPSTPIPNNEDVPVISQAELEEIIAGISQKYGVPAMAVAVVTDQGLQQAAAVGVRKWGDPTPVTLDDSWPIGSDTKIMTSALASILVDQGKLIWDSTVSDMFPDIAASIHPDFKSVTLLQLLSHQAGLPQNLGDGLPDQSASIQDQRVAVTRIALLREVTWHGAPCYTAFIAGGYSLLEESDEAMGMLVHAAHAGLLVLGDLAQHDPMLTPLRSRPDFRALGATMRAEQQQMTSA